MSRYGPKAVMEDPTEEHVKALLMKWVSIQQILKAVEVEMKRRGHPTYGEAYLRRRLRVDEALLGSLVVPPEVGTSQIMTEAWTRIARIVLNL